MEEFAPEVNRYRLIVEGYYKRAVFESDIDEFIRTFCRTVNMPSYSDPMIYSLTKSDKKIKQGFEAYQALEEANLLLNVWEDPKFFSVLIYSSKEFAIDKAIDTTVEYFQSVNFKHHTF